MDIVYEWKSSEMEPLGTPSVTAESMSMFAIEDKGATLQCEGMFVFHDHADVSGTESPWIASGVFKGGIFNWIVRRKDPKPGDGVFKSKAEEWLFCSTELVNVSIKSFIADKLTQAVEYLRAHPNVRIIDVL